MAGIVATIASWAAAIRTYLACFFTDAIWCKFFNLFFDILVGGVTVLVGAISWIPVPVELSAFQWPDVGPLGTALIESGFVQAMGILAACMTTKFLLRLLPLVRL